MNGRGRAELSNHVVGPHVVVVVSGDVDRAVAPRFRRFLLAALDSADRGTIVDLSGVELIDSSGLGALLFAFERATAGDRPFVLVFEDELLHRVFRVSGFARLYDIYPDVESAVDGI